MGSYIMSGNIEFKLYMGLTITEKDFDKASHTIEDVDQDFSCWTSFNQDNIPVLVVEPNDGVEGETEVFDALVKGLSELGFSVSGKNSLEAYDTVSDTEYGIDVNETENGGYTVEEIGEIDYALSKIDTSDLIKELGKRGYDVNNR